MYVSKANEIKNICIEMNDDEMFDLFQNILISMEIAKRALFLLLNR